MANVNAPRGSDNIIERFINYTGSLYGKLRAVIIYDSSETELFTAANPATVDSADIPTTPNEYNVTLTNADTEYSQALPANCRKLIFRCRTTTADVRYAWATGKVATPTAPYQTLRASAEYAVDSVEMGSATIYFASATAGVVMEVEAWA